MKTYALTITPNPASFKVEFLFQISREGGDFWNIFLSSIARNNLFNSLAENMREHGRENNPFVRKFFKMRFYFQMVFRGVKSRQISRFPQMDYRRLNQVCRTLTYLQKIFNLKILFLPENERPHNPTYSCLFQGRIPDLNLKRKRN